MSDNRLALYDLRSKQEYIYRTNKIREISGGSALLSKMYDKFIEKAKNEGISFINGGEWIGREFSFDDFEKSDRSAEVVYIGGGNLMVIYKNENIYRKANKLLSRMLIDETWTVNAVVSCVSVSGDFKADRAELYRQNAINKSTGSINVPCSVLPFSVVSSSRYIVDNSSLMSISSYALYLHTLSQLNESCLYLFFSTMGIYVRIST